MDLLATLPAFLLAVLLISASPGPAMALVLRHSALHGSRAAVPTVLGLEAGLYVWALAAGAGLAAVVAASEVAYLVLRVVGAAVLFFLGYRALRAALDGPAVEDVGAAAPPGGSARRRFTEGFVVQLANPKAAVFMFAFYPQFVPAESALAWTAGLALLQVLVETALYLGLAAVVGRASRWFRRPRVRRRLEALSGTVLVALAVRMAVTPR